MRAPLLKVTLAAGLAASLCAAPFLTDTSASAPAAPAPASGAVRCPVVDVLVVHTPKAAERLGGQHRVPASAQRIATRMNRSLAADGLCGTIRIVHPYTAKEYDGSEEFRAAYAVLKDHTSGLGRQVHEQRERYGADLVTLVVERAERGGGTADYTSALDSSTHEYAYSVVEVDGIELDSASHEIGHNLGLAHDRTTLASDTGGSMNVSRTRPYNTGWITEDGQHYTLMAYRASCGTHCKRISRFSSAKGSWRGHRLGDESNDSVRVLRETMPIVAGYRSKT
ncbi:MULTISPECIES: M12 family metallo-peptidase [Streptomyces]|uniref:M12 family metallo-peptidase n=1 Tax=Streptomyces TaxID=1883 RepID=UPI000D51635C|nr:MULTISPECIES: M12 family metallo-peptidase [Streptomyces]MXG28665.1 peptidyl-Asp metallopeptidase [Streptomyces sp. YIM 132580]NYS21256.1 peptidyl-Asp metallopeptidase [Streptomyces sp. SJ1-7]PVC62341.1 peptidyl-Asp metallopeptidase [Streptomyces sp. CS065A]